MSTYSLAPYEQRQYFDDNGDPLALGKVYTYVTGSSTPLGTFSTSTGTANTNPVILDAAGRCRIYLQPTAYKFIVTDANDVPVGLTMDPVSAVGVGTAALGEVFVFGSNSSTPVTVTSYASGATFDKLQPGSAVFTEDSANLSGTYVIRVTGVQVTAGTLSVSLMNLSDGAPDTPIATATITSLTGEVANSAAITWGSSGSVKNYGIKAKVSANNGYVIGVTLVRTA